MLKKSVKRFLRDCAGMTFQRAIYPCDLEGCGVMYSRTLLVFDRAICVLADSNVSSEFEVEDYHTGDLIAAGIFDSDDDIDAYIEACNWASRLDEILHIEELANKHGIKLVMPEF